jgi:GT2 family glycosyltransferase
MFISPNFLSRACGLIERNGSGVVVGFRVTCGADEIPDAGDWREPSSDLDWRRRVVVTPDLIDLTVLNVGGTTNRCVPGETIDLCGRSHGFRNIGIRPERTIGLWDLASMVVSHSMAIDRESFERIGGFPEWVRGWGGEDTVLGFSVRAADVPVMPSGTSGYQAQHPPYSGSEKMKISELRANLAVYRDWARSADSFPFLDPQLIRARAHASR